MPTEPLQTLAVLNSTESGAVHATPESLERGIARVLNCHSTENASNTPDFILAQYLIGCLAAWNAAVQQREAWCGRDARPSASMPASCAVVGCVSKGPHGHGASGVAVAVR